MLSAKLKAIRTNAGLSQVKFAKLLGVPRQTLRTWESGQVTSLRGPSLKILQKTLKLTDQALLDLFYESAAPPSDSP